ncbi:neuronal PAS domain-containing protein 4-like isoform X1 [Pangasianodon hypophthalmus]|uniref:neuronal PAS domain-containing protein 4-like isoform X1 n=1 Tax=Pangasianodon hypophthalmus TaxID=310915 RepID=UPI000F004E5F|nr:neuronal PAS domain-containing protein 4-like isoform X1 [Pangasianodon hypophthalmus]XP_053088295.1 neuronal PAS domain-containing protein 4-like isoform X1 [Pangasianodon hypophthalmus]
MTLGHSLSYYSPSSLFSSSSSSTSSSPVARGSIRKNRKFRSTKGASKARRDLINAEIRKLRALLPISAEERERLSYLHAMSVICTFIRKSVLLARDGVCVAGGDEGVTPACEDQLNALPGFLVAMTSEGKLLYVSENVSHYLGLSMVEVLQGDTFYSMITNIDTEKVKFYLQHKNLNTERSCVCVFRTNRQCCPLLVRMRVFDPQRGLVVALCSPSLRERDSFTTTHTPDMRYTHTHYSVVLHLGYEAEELIGQSWYSIIHPDDLLLSARGHKQLMHCEQVDFVLRVQDKQLNWVWLYIIATRHTQSHMITCTNYIISEVVAEDLRHKLSTVSSVSSPSLSPPGSQNSQRSTKRPAEGSAESRRRKNRRVSTAASSSLPYSPNSSFSSPAQEVGNIDLLFSSSAFCPFYTSPSQNFQWPNFDSTPLTPPPFCYPSEVSVPDDHAELPGSLSDSFLYLEDFNSFPSSATGNDRTFNAPEDYGWSSLQTPPPPPLHYSEMEQVEISVLAQQISSLASSFDSYCTKSSVHRSDLAPGLQFCDPEAFLLDEEVIDSVMQVPRATLEVQALEALLDLERCSEEQQHEFSLYSHTQQDGFSDESLY